MATDKQIAANQANAQKSTGPKTEIGKSSSSKHAVKHGTLPHEYRALKNVLPIETQILVGRYQTTLSNQISQTLKELRAEQKLREQLIEIAPKVTRIEK